MTDKDEAARQKAKALARWEGEGGALVRPDAALLLEWNGAPAAGRGAIFQNASSLHVERDAPRIKHTIERFMKEHKDRGRRAPGE